MLELNKIDIKDLTFTGGVVNVIEKSGRTHELDDLYEKLNKYGILQYVRSARIAVTKAPLMISEILRDFKKK